MNTLKAIVSGATKGIGKAIALALAKEGCDLAIGSRNLSELKLLKSEFKKINSKTDVIIQMVDFSQKKQSAEFAKTVIERWGKADVIVNNVGTYAMGGICEEDEDMLDKMLHTNLYSAYYLTKPFLQGMKQARSGNIFNICSIASLNPLSTAASYSISKAALYAFSKVLSDEMRHYNVKVTAILPGPVKTSSWDGDPTAVNYNFIEPDDIANSIVNTLKSSAGSVTETIVLQPLLREY